MLKDERITKQFTDMMTEGFIYIDTAGKIQIYNHKAKEIFGITSPQGEGHQQGQIKEGDIVIFGDNCLGKDDGGLTPEDLQLIGIDSNEIQLGDAIVGIGVMGDRSVAPIFVNKKPREFKEELSLQTIFLTEKIHVMMDQNKKYISISINGQEFKMQYNVAIGHMVVLDQKSHQVKFYQAKGYTARGESLKNLLLGNTYRAKGKGVEDLNVIGRHIFEIHSNSPNTQEFYEVATGGQISYENQYREINGRATICSLMPVDLDNRRIGAVLKVEDISEIRRIIRERDEALLHLEEVERKLREEENVISLFPEILGESPEINQVKKLAYRASKTNSTVVLLGESGTGKTLLAKAIHDAGRTKHYPFIHVNCGSIPENLLESELFGYEAGAFTGASRGGKKGMFELAQGGTLFLDEIGEISPLIQVKLLQALQNKTFFPVGGSKSITVDVRIIVATNKNLEEEVEQGRFREDLYYRINVFPIWIPPLRQRIQDIYPIVDTTLKKICKRVGLEEKRVSIEALNLLCQHDWPGNVRELENILERAVNLTEGSLIHSSHLAMENQPQTKTIEKETLRSLKEMMMEAEKKAIEETLKIYEGDKQKTMEALNIRKTSFYEKIKKYGL
ncbi:sigma-54 interaction domain-containing protein [Alkaliphilus hydrothermalis]|uniref:Transcriptional regulator with PAS, ATPase and Fis domain n=1 Tax=Alkaliphilus hydrothermalis TaxID=1482730 RepID=A0ABS2NU16_9FIRM|nr:sigma 54-interacting transcriptional regulator [Alkaliphilus hydrothermalis]MBM7616438.1 transcriptional regulator with PAS, ATPase and Fis domain [Alkaliphilus hydrothermalis]